MSETPSDWERAKLDDVLNTTALVEREARAPSYAGEIDAWVALSQTMGTTPDSMWERMCTSLLALIPGASSAGIMLVNAGTPELVQHVCGRLASALGGRKLRGCNPWRLTVERDAAQLFSRPARHYQWLGKLEPPIYELLTHPMQSHDGLTGVLWVSSDGPDGTFDAEDQRVLARFATLAGSCHALLTRRDRGRERYADLQQREGVRAALFGVLRSDLDPHAVQFEAARIIADHMMVNRVMYVDVVDEGRTAVIEADYCRDAISMAGRYPLSAFGAEVLRSLSAGRPLALDDTHASSLLTESDRTTYEAFGIRSIVAVPLIRNGRLVALLSVHQRTPRAWRATDVVLIEEAAEREYCTITYNRS
jgi:GAF domain-containing protein